MGTPPRENLILSRSAYAGEFFSDVVLGPLDFVRSPYNGLLIS